MDAAPPANGSLAYCPPDAAPIPGNRVDLLRDGREAFPAMLDAIEGARRSIHLEMYIFADDGAGRRFAEALAAAAMRGVEVAVLYDSLGSWRTHPWIFDWMRAHEVRVLGYRPLLPWRRGWGWPRRDHRKILVVDGTVAFTGGINVTDDWMDPSTGGRGWRDTMIRIEGPAAAAFDALFRRVWEREARRQRRSAPLLPPPPPAPAAGDVPVVVVANGERRRRRAIRRAYRWAIRRATERICIANPYFVPDPGTLRSLRRARQRGVRVLLLLPGTSDVASVQWAARATYQRLLEWGVEIFHWCAPVFHAKTAAIDGAWASVGTCNLDTQSLRYNLEVTAVVPDRRMARILERMFLDDLDRCKKVDLATWRRRPWWWRLPERFFYLFRAWL